MFPAPFRVVLDANVLFPFTLRDTLLRAAAAGFFQLYWSDEAMVEIVKEQAAALRRPPRSFDEVVIGLEKLVPSFARSVRDHARTTSVP